MKQIESMGILGLGVMGRNLAFNLADKGFTVAAYDPWEEARSRFATAQVEEGFAGITLADNPAAFIAAHWLSAITIAQPGAVPEGSSSASVCR